MKCKQHKDKYLEGIQGKTMHRLLLKNMLPSFVRQASCYAILADQIDRTSNLCYPFTHIIMTYGDNSRKGKKPLILTQGETYQLALFTRMRIRLHLRGRARPIWCCTVCKSYTMAKNCASYDFFFLQINSKQYYRSLFNME